MEFFSSIILIAFVFYLIFRLQAWKQKKDTQKHLENIRREMPYPFIRKTPIRMRLWNSIKYTYKTGNCTKFEALYSLFAKTVLSFMHENYDSICPDDLTGKYRNKIESEKVFLYILPYCYSYLLLDSYEKHYNLPLYLDMLEECNTKFLKDYAMITGAEYNDVINFSKQQLNLYFPVIEKNSHLPLNELKKMFANIFVQNFMQNYLQTNYDGIRVNILGCISVYTIIHLEQTGKYAKTFCKEVLIK